MTTLIETFSGPVWRQILLTLAHSLWQGVLLTVLLAIILSRLAANRPHMRYACSLAALVALVVSSAATWSVLDLPQPNIKLITDTLERSDDSRLLANADSPILAATTAAPDQPIPNASPATAATVINPQATASALCVAAWLLGVAVMLTRMAWLVTGARRLALRPAITDRRVLDMVSEIRQRFGIRRPIRTVDAAAIGPAVIGILRPVLLLPVAMISELPPDCLEPILAHELAHIRRHDYLVNLLQMLIEAALFFNPAVWWISRQVRREREACCDALAVGLTGQPLTYSEALAAWLEHMPSSRLAPAVAGWLGDNRGGSLLDRVRRLIVADYRPELRGTWSGFASGLTLSMLVLIMVWSGTRASVALAAEALAGFQRIQQLARQRDSLRPLTPSDAEATLSGSVQFADGQPLPSTIQASICTQKRSNAPYHGTTSTLKLPNFSVRSPWGKTWLIAFAPGFAPTLVPPFTTTPGETHAGLEIVLSPGFTSRIKVVDSQGRPVSGAVVSATFKGTGMSVPAGWRTDDEGIALAENLGSFPYKLSIAAAGFQTLRTDPLEFGPDKTLSFTLAAAQPTRGVVTGPEGEPIAAATIRRVRCLRGGIFIDDTPKPVLATTDAQGQFTLDSLNDGKTFGFLVETTDGRRRFIPEVRAGQTDLRWIVGPDFTVDARIVDDSAVNDPLAHPTRLTYEQTESPKGGGEFEITRGVVEVKSDGTERRFHLEHLVPGPVALHADRGTIMLWLNESATDVELHLPATRRVVLNFVESAHGLSPAGQIYVGLSGPDKQSNQNIHAELSNLTIQDGMVALDAYVGGTVSYDAANVVGFWFASGSFEVPAGVGLLEHDVLVVAAGAIRVKVFDQAGVPVDPDRGLTVSAETIEKASLVENLQPNLFQHSLPSVNWTGRYGTTGESFLAPLPLGGRYAVRAERGYEIALSQPVLVDETNPSPQVDVVFPATRDFVGRVVGPGDQPIVGTDVYVELRSKTSHMRYKPPHTTDVDGRFHLRLSAGNDDFWVTVVPRRDLAPLETQLPANGESLDIHLQEPGGIIVGRVIDDTTASPLVGVVMHALPCFHRTWIPEQFDAEAPTDGDGHFRFSNLPAGEYYFAADNGVTWPQRHAQVRAKPGGSVVLRGVQAQ